MQYIVIDRATGALVQMGEDAAASISMQAQPGQVAVPFSREDIEHVVFDNGFTAMRPKLDVLLPVLLGLIDAEAGAFRQGFLTDIPGQDGIYVQKRAEALAWIQGDEVSHPERYPFILAEATVRGLPFEQVHQEIADQVHQQSALAFLEAQRVNAKCLTREAETSTDAIKAANVDWAGLLVQYQQQQEGV